MDSSGVTAGSSETGAPIGATPVERGVYFRVWAPEAHQIEVVFDEINHQPNAALEPGEDGYFAGIVRTAQPNDRYKFSVDGAGPFPDPASRHQPDGPDGWSVVVDANAFPWNPGERSRGGVKLKGQVLYELHIGTFTPEGTFRGAEQEFPRLAKLGVTVLEIMPVAEFAGEFGWGYDGVSLFAPYHLYGTPDDLRHMVDAAHRNGLAVILDVVYNHLGPVGNYLPRFSAFYFSRHTTDWGDALNFDDERSRPVREFFLQNAAYWIRDFHMDGLRLDATQSINDCGAHGSHILSDIGCAARKAAGARDIILLSECERQDSEQLAPVPDGCGLDGMWNDDLHHSAMVRLTGKREAYYSDHLGRAQEFISAAKWGFLFQGQFYSWQNGNRGTSFLNVEPWRPVTFLENHDQVANSLQGKRPRAHTSAGRYRAMAAYWLLTPGTPMFFMGQEYGSTQPFFYFSDHQGELREKVRAGRTEFLTQFESIRGSIEILPHPDERSTFQRSKLDAEEQRGVEGIQLQKFFRDLLRIRRDDKVVASQERGAVDGATLSEDCFLLRFFARSAAGREGDRLLLVNFGPFLELVHLPEPLLAPPTGSQWKCAWNSEEPAYGGSGAVDPITATGWHIQGDAAILLIAEQRC